MTSEIAHEQAEEAEVLPTTKGDALPTRQVANFHYRRDISPKNISLSERDLKEFIDLLTEVNERAKKLEIERAGTSKFEDEADAQRQADDFMPVEHRYTDSLGDSVQGLGPLNVDEKPLPASLNSIYVSNTSFTKRVFDGVPNNAVDAFIDFRRPSLAIDLITSPSNPTENATIINVYGLNEDWVISTESKINRFFDERKVLRPAIHGSGVYDSFIWLLFVPFLIWAYLRTGELGQEWLDGQNAFISVLLAIYFLFLSLFGARFIFQYFRWLFPPVEYFRKSTFGANLHRIIASFIGVTMAGTALSDLVGSLISALF